MDLFWGLKLSEGERGFVFSMSSLQIAEISGKPHNDVLKAIRAMESAWVKTTGEIFPLSSYTDKSGKQNPCYELTKTECLYIATNFNDEARAKLVIRWEELEQQSQQSTAKALPQDYKQALIALVQEVEAKEALQAQIKEEAPKVAFANAIITCNTSCLIGELAKLITQNGVNIGQNRLFKWMRGHGYISVEKTAIFPSTVHRTRLV